MKLTKIRVNIKFLFQRQILLNENSRELTLPVTRVQCIYIKEGKHINIKVVLIITHHLHLNAKIILVIVSGTSTVPGNKSWDIKYIYINKIINPNKSVVWAPSCCILVKVPSVHSNCPSSIVSYCRVKRFVCLLSDFFYFDDRSFFLSNMVHDRGT